MRLEPLSRANSKRCATNDPAVAGPRSLIIVVFLASCPTRCAAWSRVVHMKLEKSFDPHAIEERWYPAWESRGYFAHSRDLNKPAYCLQLPPPNITGTLHMGHAFQQTLMDALIRYHRMRGDNTNW